MINNKWLTPLLMAIYKKLYFKSIERYADVIITLTPEAKKLWRKSKRVEVIPNFTTMTTNQHSNCTNKRIIAVGRLEREKGFERLIEIWGLVCRKYPDWHLDIYGEGKMYDALITLTNIHKASNVTIHHFTPNISYEYSTSSICATTSYFEGFSLVILEAMKHGVPCVAFDCPFGPRSIINDGYDGLIKVCPLIRSQGSWLVQFPFTVCRPSGDWRGVGEADAVIYIFYAPLNKGA